MWRRWVAVCSVLIAFLAIGCGDDGPPDLTVSPGMITLAKGRMGMVSARVDGRAAGSEVTWRSADPAIATVTEGSRGAATIAAVAAGTTTVTATQDGATARLTVVVTAAEVESLAITPAMPALAAGTEADLTVTATLSDGTTSNVTATVEWTSSDATKATVSAAGRLRGVAAGTATLTAKLGNKMAMVTATISNAVLESIAVTPADLSLPRGLTQQMTAIGTFSDDTTQDLTATATWASSNGTNAPISTGGLVTGANVGPSTISATSNGVTGSVAIDVTAALLESIAVTPADSQLAAGSTLEFTATGTFSDDTTQDISATATWTSSDLAVATMNGRTATGVAAGDTTITATLNGVSGSTDLEVTQVTLVSIAVTPADSSTPKGLTQQLTATGTFSDDSTQDLTQTVTWASGDTAVVQVSNADGSRGLATAMDVGTAEVTATQDGVTGATSFETTPPVLTSVTLSPSGDLARGTSRQLTATARYSDASTTDVTAQAEWTTSSAADLTVNNTTTKGLANALTTAGATISATFGGMTGDLAIGGCKILVNEVQTASAAGPGDEWVEIASTCTATQSLGGLRIVYRSAAGGGGDNLNIDLTNVTLAPNEYKFWVHVNFASVYPTRSGTFGTGGSGAVSATAGGFGLRFGDVNTGPLSDSMGWGPGVTNGLVEGTTTGAPANGTAAARFPDRADTDNNSVDFAARTPTPGAANQ